MPKICHVFDRDTGWEQRTAFHLLHERCPRMGWDVAALSLRPAAASAVRTPEFAVQPAAPIDAPALLAAPLLKRMLRPTGADVVHAWGWRAAVAARAAGADRIVMSTSEPDFAPPVVKRLRLLCDEGGFAVACSADRVRRRLVEQGIPMECSVVVRPGIDFGLINRFRRSGLREQLGVSRDDMLVALAEPVTRAGGQRDALWSVHVLNFLDGHVRCLPPRGSVQGNRLAALEKRSPLGSMLVNDGGMPYEQLVTVADTLLLACKGDVSTTPIAWAMAAETLVVATATYAVTELIASGLNGLLFKRDPGRAPIAAILKALRDRDRHGKLKEAARGQAFKVFGAQRHAEQTARLYDNLLADRAADDGIVDSALEQ